MEFERQETANGFSAIAGVDEAGRGPLAGPVVAAACIVYPGAIVLPGVNDSKKLTAAQRKAVYQQLTQDKQVHYGIGLAEAAEIDQINIYQATIQAMLRAVAALTVAPDLLLVDGLALPHPTLPVRKIVGGDALCYSIAAASILAKVYRDRLMVAFHQQWPQYGFDQHKGYGTEKHCKALSLEGPCPIHRRSFAPVREALRFFAR